MIRQPTPTREGASPITSTSKLAPIGHRLPRRERHRAFAARVPIRWSRRGCRPADLLHEDLPEGITEIRTATPSDATALLAFYEALDGESRYRRFLQAMPRITTAMAEHVLTPPNVVLLAFDHDSRVVAEVVFAPARRDGDPAEVAYAVANGHRRRGLATTMIRRSLADAARAGYREVEAMIGGDNAGSIALMRSLGARTRFEDGAIIARLDLDHWSGRPSVTR